MEKVECRIVGVLQWTGRVRSYLINTRKLSVSRLLVEALNGRAWSCVMLLKLLARCVEKIQHRCV